tara:strand:- start:1519 stop:3627 length:2109 start_codon:yes stop_codon:yes gene_type:complete
MNNIYNQGIDILNQNFINFDAGFTLAGVCADLLDQEEYEDKGRDLVIRSLDKFNDLHPNIRCIFEDLIDVSGLYPYLEDIQYTGAALRKEFHKSKYLEDVYLHREQQHVSNLLLEDQSVVLSAPTSFGKSLLIQEIVASEKHSNIVIIQPTLALLDETRKKLQKYKKYKLLVSTRQEPIKGKNLFLFTAERVLEYSNFPKIDFFVIDEFYKLSLSRDDDRAIVLNQAFYKLLNYTSKFYLLGPLVTNLDPVLPEKHQLTWIKTEYATVSVNQFEIGSWKQNEEKLKKQALFSLLDDLDSQTLIYCSSPDKASELAHEYYMHINSYDIQTSENDYIIDWCKDNIHKDWSLPKYLHASIGIHHGAIPRHLGSTIVDSFNEGNIKYLFCTATLIEGVNTNAKNVVLYHKKKGPKRIDFFDFKNISGRAGRMKEHFVGNIYKLEKEPDQLSFDVDIPIISQENATDDLLLYLNEDDLLPKSKEILQKYENLAPAVLALVKSNSGVPIEGQLELLKDIQDHQLDYYPFLNWNTLPNYNQLKKVINLAWRYLRKKTDSKGGLFTADQLTFYTWSYFRTKSIGGLISYLISKGDNPEKAISTSLNTLRTWFEFKLPKFIITVSSIQAYVYSEERAGNYNYYATQIEHGFLPPNLSDLIEYNIPTSLARKLLRITNEEDSIDIIIERVKSMDRSSLNLIEYEERLLDKVI